MVIYQNDSVRANTIRYTVRHAAVYALQKSFEAALDRNDFETIPVFTEALRHAVNYHNDYAFFDPDPEKGYKKTIATKYLNMPFSACNPADCTDCIFKHLCEFEGSHTLGLAAEKVLFDAEQALNINSSVNTRSQDHSLTNDFKQVFGDTDRLNNGQPLAEKEDTLTIETEDEAERQQVLKSQAHSRRYIWMAGGGKP